MGDWFLAYLRRMIDNPRIQPVTLKSPKLLPAKGQEHGGQLFFIFNSGRPNIEVKPIQEALNTHAQDIHNSYAEKMWGDLVMSLARLIAKCT
jgi:hypothetical protein